MVGIVASRLVERFFRPVFVLSEENGEAQGSGRSIAAFHLLDALESMPDLFTRFGGHRQAAGVSLSSERVVRNFADRLNAYAAARLTPADFRPQLAIDALVDLKELTTGPAVQEILAMAPFGFGNPAPVLAIVDAEIAAPPHAVEGETSEGASPAEWAKSAGDGLEFCAASRGIRRRRARGRGVYARRRRLFGEPRMGRMVGDTQGCAAGAITESFRESFEQLAIARAREDSIFGVPLDGDGERVARPFQSFDYAVGSDRGDDQSMCQAGLPPGDGASSPRARLHPESRPGACRRATRTL